MIAARLSPSASVYLDCIRGCAAVIVFLSHTRGVFFIDYAHSVDRSAWVKAIYASTGSAHSAVIVFFVLSGLLISDSALRSVQAGKWSPKRYLIQRLSRLYVVLLPALALGSLLDQAGLHFFPSTSIYDGSHGFVIQFPVVERADFATFLGNLLFCQEILCKPFGSNGALWSLSYEFWYYILFPLVLFAWRARSLLIRALCGLGSVAILYGVGPTIACYFSIWLMGTAIAVLPRPTSAPRWVHVSAIAMGLVLFVASLAAARAQLIHNSFVMDAIVGCATSALLYAVVILPHHELRPIVSFFATRLAGMSYTLYLTHLSAVVFLSALLGANAQWQLNAKTAAIVGAAGAAVFGYSWLVSQLTEAHTAKVRDWLIARYDSGTPASPGEGRFLTKSLLLLVTLGMVGSGSYVESRKHWLAIYVLPNPALEPSELPPRLALEAGDRLVFLGDSLTEQGGESGGFVSLIETTLSRYHASLGIKVFNAGIGGNKVLDLQNRLDAVLALKPNVACVLIGINDVYRAPVTPVEQFESRLGEIVLRLQQSGSVVLLCTPPVIGEERHGSNPLDGPLDECAAAVRHVAGLTQSKLCDLRGAFMAHQLETATAGSPERLTTDGIHLNRAGNRLVATKILQAIAQPGEPLSSTRSKPPQ
jgi:peptidoglycan/LPS O-acetylase OafA/YrhL/lysophospholipase L1-like esterase